MRRELAYGVAALRRRPLLSLAAWSVPEALPAALSGLVIAHSVDNGFLAGRPITGLAWLGGLLVASMVGAAGARMVYRNLGELTEPFRDDLVRRVVAGALRTAVAGRPDDGAVARLTRQVEIVRDTYAGLIVVVRGFVVTTVGVVLGLLSLAPAIALLIVPPFALGVVAFVATLGIAAARQRAAVRADERLAASAGAVLSGVRDIAARGAEEHAAAMVSGPIAEQAAAERALARVAVLRTLCFALGGWLPLLILLAGGPWLVARGVTAGAIMGGLTYVLFGLQGALGALIGGLGGSGMRFVVTLGRILDSTATPPPDPRPAPARPDGFELAVRKVTFAYGPHAEPVLNRLDLRVPEGDHLAIVGPSGIGKSTLAGLLCGLLRPLAGTVRLGGVPIEHLPAHARVLIPQEAYVFTGTVRDNVTYLRPTATSADATASLAAVGADGLVTRLGGLEADVRPNELSAGERQLLALARAHLSEAPLIVLDEATCHLDAAAERRAEQAFAERAGTVIVIAHRVSSALRARRVLVLDGRDATLGTPDEVRAASPLFRELLGHWHAPTTESAVTGPP